MVEYMMVGRHSNEEMIKMRMMATKAVLFLTLPFRGFITRMYLQEKDGQHHEQYQHVHMLQVTNLSTVKARRKKTEAVTVK